MVSHIEGRTYRLWRVLRRISAPERDKVTGLWVNWYDEELHNLSFLHVIKVTRSQRWAGYVAHREMMRNANK